ncbi:unnamed protein product [Adineta ricciae]|uniref:RBR-type E3 ubiquitin transferase n=1 Tax=Adineta ricciae TaxID=249248 RepID=A0A813Y0A7_ADIRI|nr:unnamed protein product [Adineta ricciae]
MAESENRHSQTWPFHRPSPNGNTPTEFNANSQRNLTHHQSLKSIFVTDSSKTLHPPQNHVILAMDRGDLVTTSFQRSPSAQEALFECPICCSTFPIDEIKQMLCCSTNFCSSCLVTHTMTNIRNGKVKIECPGCSEEMNSLSILYNHEIPLPVRERYQELLAEALAEKQNTNIKLCPHCNFITILDENDPLVNRKKTRRPSREWILCGQCNKEWCWSCYAPSHPNETCRQFKKNHTQLDMWAQIRRTDNQQRNAQRCPKCLIYIEKIDGCDHMLCTKCNSKFCYRCGSRMRLPLYIGHDAKYSVFGCKYKLWPDCALLRWLIRGSILVGLIILTPIALAAVIALVAIGVPILIVVGCFALPIYAYIKHSTRT